MTDHRRTLFVGLGSRHGDDQVGWVIADRLAQEAPEEVAVRRALSPTDLLDWIHTTDRLAVCDACQTTDEPGRLHRWDWPTDEIATVRAGGTHDLSLVEVLRLAGRLEQLPRDVVIFGITARTFDPELPLSAELEARVPELASAIRTHLRNDTCTKLRS